MRHLHPTSLAVALLAGTLSLSACGSGKTQTVSVSSATTQAGASDTVAHPAVAPTTTTPATKRPPRSTTRTAPSPAFTQTRGSSSANSGEGSGGGAAGAIGVVRAHGFIPTDPSVYRPEHTLAVLVGTRAGSSDGHDQQAFFFVNGRYIGTDASQPSASVKVVSQGDTEVTLAYTLYRPHDPSCCPSAGQADVRFQLDNGRLAPLDAIPPVSSASAPSRQ